eukprot:TRINITY_DN13138_c0_g1_i1.p1 TRINITY_DN13138_c0_g1~~TRINITY_DN13138_c0_g1_i1.p1  ORF type:complete len:754 (+),score=190.24 TRINITY_DN13138_c0_g1_i1:109-2262(+)
MEGLGGALQFFALLLAGRLVSWAVYLPTWFHLNAFLHAMRVGGDARQRLERRAELRRVRWALWRFLTVDWHWWAVHAPLTAALLGAEWGAHNAGLRRVALTAAGLLLGKAVLRLGVLDLDNLFVLDRVGCVALWVGAWQHPALLYWSVVASCLSTYLVGTSEGLAAPYSNYLGYELCRWVACYAIAALCFEALVPSSAAAPGAVGTACVVAAAADYYFRHGLGKVRLAPSPTEWVLNNRIECLAVNSYLRGWHAEWLPMEGLLGIAKLLRAVRIPMCAAGVVAECAGVLALFARPIAVVWMGALAGFHASVFVLAGLCDWEGVALLSVTAYTLLLGEAATTECFGASWAAASIAWSLCSAAWGIYVQSLDSAKVKILLFDAADLLMCWWDSPYMRMFTYIAETDDGRRYRFPVTLFSPYDTLITDIHTRLNCVGLYPGLDRQRTADAKVVPCGVWGLLLNRDAVRDVYRLQDSPAALPFARAEPGAAVRMVPRGTNGARYLGRVVRKEPAYAVVEWAPEQEGGPPPELGIPKEQSQTSDWWDGGGQACVGHGGADPAETLRRHFCPVKVPPWTVTPETPADQAPAAVALRNFAAALNRRQSSKMWRLLWRWPHFPGEDFAPDFSPLLDAGLPRYHLGRGRIRKLHVWRVKTFFTGSAVLRLDAAGVGEITLPAEGAPAAAPEGCGPGAGPVVDWDAADLGFLGRHGSRGGGYFEEED